MTTVNRPTAYVGFDPAKSLTPVAVTKHSCIDRFYDSLARLTVLAVPPVYVISSHVGQLVLLGAMSATESYFRDVLGRIVGFCSFSRERSYALTVSFGTFEYYTPAEYALALNDETSFSNPENIIERVHAITGISLKQLRQKNPDLHTALSDFGKVCHLRHACTHSFGRMTVKSALRVGISGLTSSRVVDPDPVSVQDSVAVCQNVVRCTNQILFDELVRRMFKNGDIRLHRNPSGWSDDKEMFDALFRCFVSRADGTVRNCYDLWRKVRTELNPI